VNPAADENRTFGLSHASKGWEQKEKSEGRREKMRAEAAAVSSTAILFREASESELLARCRTGDLEAFAQLVQRYRNRIFNLAWQLLGNRDDAEDVAQETFLHAFEHLSEFRGDAQMLTWLYRIAINACKMKMRQRRFIEPLPEDFEPAEEIDWSEVEERWLLKRKIDAVLAKLSEPLRLVLVLREMHELSYDEIASVLCIPVGTVRSRLFEARRKFAQIWREMFGDEIR
jgi:RNA polymerase sigma-70 factor (ECF subfamily)